MDYRTLITCLEVFHLNTCNKVTWNDCFGIVLDNPCLKIGITMAIFILSLFYHTTVVPVPNYSCASIWLRSLILLVGLSSCGAVVPLSYITIPSSLSSLLSSVPFLLCMFMLMIISKHSSLPPQLPRSSSRVASLAPSLSAKTQNSVWEH